MINKSLVILEERLRGCAQQVVEPFAADSRRWFHGRGHCYSGLEFLTVDYFSPVLLVTFFYAPPADVEEKFWRLIDELVKHAGAYKVTCVVCQRRYLSSAPSEIYYGSLPDKVFAQRGLLQFELELARQQNSGYFLDMEPGRLWLEHVLQERSEPANVLNLFAYTCAFSVVAQNVGARQVVNVDMSRAALNRGRSNHYVNGQRTDNIVFLQENILKSWGRIKKYAPYDVLIVDPPSYQPGSFVASKDYTKLLRRIPQLASDGADILCCLNSPELDESFVDDCYTVENVPCKKLSRLTPSPDFPDVESQKSLKLLHYRYVREPE